MTSILFTAALTLLLAAALLRRADSTSRPLALSLLISAPLITISALLTADTYTNAVWNSARAVIPVSLVHGVPPYFPPGEGPLWASIYPPLAYLLYTPIALAQTPSNVIRLGQALNLLFLFVPLTILLFRSTPRSPSRNLHIFFALLISLTLATTQLGLSNATFIVHVDPPAIGFALAACIPLLRATTPSRNALALSAVLTAASIFCKQTMLPVALALPLYLALTCTPRAALTHFLFFLATSALFAAACLLVFSPSGMLNNIFVVPSSHPLRDDHPHPFIYAVGQFTKTLWPVVFLAGLAVRLNWLKHPWFNLRQMLVASPAFLLFFVALALLPTSLAGFAKFGGFVNNFASSGYFFLAALATAIPRALIRPTHLLAFRLVPYFALLTCIALSLHRLVTIYNLPPRPSIHDTAYLALLDHPDRIYFPWLPLSHYLASHTLTHQSFGILDREKANQPVSDAWLHQYLPPHTELLAFDTPPTPDDRAHQRLSPLFPLPATTPFLPGWTLLARQPASPAKP